MYDNKEDDTIVAIANTFSIYQTSFHQQNTNSSSADLQSRLLT